jgi:phosphinothricin acetyltransferase
MNARIRDVMETDGPAIMVIFNHFVANSFATYTDQEAGMELFQRFRSNASVFLVLLVEEKPAGFGLIQPYLPFASCRRTGMLTYFILPEFTGKGYGSKILEMLIAAGKEKGITNLVAHISSKNAQSLAFHRKHGFRECGRLKNVGIKFDQSFDVIWVQRPEDPLQKKSD